MATKPKPALVPVLLCFLLLFFSLAVAKRDPPLEQCEQQCQQSQKDPDQREECERRCKEQFGEGREQEREPNLDHRNQGSRELQHCKQECRQQQHRERERRECERRCEGRYEEESERGRSNQGRRRELLQCKQQCRQQQQHDERERRECERRCGERYGEEREQRGSGGDRNYRRREWGEEEEEESERENPYHWRSARLRVRIRTEHGHVRVLERFTRRSELLRVLENYRLVILEINPNTFVIPSHKDAESICFVARGRGTVTFVGEDNKELHDLEEGDIIRVPAGTTSYLINRDDSQKLQVVKLLQPVFTPGRFRDYFAAGGENPETFFKSFSDEILEAAFNIKKERLGRVFGQQRRGAIVRASPQQIRALSEGSSTGKGLWPFGVESRRGKAYNLFNEKRPSYSNDHGELYEADPNDYQQLRDLDVAVSFANITRGSMIAPYYNSRATKISVVVDGRGYFEMACPHISGEQGRRESWRKRGEEQKEEEEEEDEEEERQPRYHKVRARLSPGDVLIVPAGHPITTVAARDENLQVLCFETNTEDNQKYFLAGQNNILKQIEREAKELAFGVPAREVDQVLNAQRETVFLPGPGQRRQQERERREGRDESLKTTLGFVAF